MTKSRRRRDGITLEEQKVLRKLAKRNKCLHEHTLTTDHAKLVGGDTYCRICGEEVK